MDKWRSVREIVQFSTKGITPKYVEKSSILVLNQKCIRNNKIDYSFARYTDDTRKISASKTVKKGDILINSTGRGTAGRCAFVNELPANVRLITDSHVLLLRCKSYYEAQCLSYSLYSFEKTIQSFMDGSTGQSELDKIRLLNILTNIPEDEETQKKIASTLSALDSKIELNNKINTELENMAKLLYDYWFVQFDFPNENGKPYKSLGGKMVFNKVLKREVPEGWEVGRLSDVINITTGKLNSNAEVIGGKYPFYTCAAEPTTIDKYAYDDTVILIAGNNAAGNFHINRYKGKFNAYQRTYILTAKNEIELEYIYQMLKMEVKMLKKRGKGSQTKFLTLGMLTNIKIFHINEFIMLKFNKILTPLYERQVNISKENQKLTALRDFLLPMLMNGQVQIQ